MLYDRRSESELNSAKVKVHAATSEESARLVNCERRSGCLREPLVIKVMMVLVSFDAFAASLQSK
jgi:hypothetical protein